MLRKAAIGQKVSAVVVVGVSAADGACPGGVALTRVSEVTHTTENNVFELSGRI